MSETPQQRNKRELAELYNTTPDEFSQISARELFVLKQVIEHQYNHIIESGFSFYFEDYEPYGENPQIIKVLPHFRSGWLNIHTTGNNSKVWGAYTNLQFRALHDFIHCDTEAEFDHESEKKVLEAQYIFARKVSGTKFRYANWELFYKILRSEIVYQSAVKEIYGEFHITQKVILKNL